MEKSVLTPPSRGFVWVAVLAVAVLSFALGVSVDCPGHAPLVADPVAPSVAWRTSVGAQLDALFARLDVIDARLRYLEADLNARTRPELRCVGDLCTITAGPGLSVTQGR